MKKLTIRPMKPGDYRGSWKLWSETAGVGLSASDSKKNILSFLRRNPGLSLVALSGKRLVATALCGHDGRRGCIFHLAVAPDFRRKGVATKLVDRCLRRLGRMSILKCNIFVFRGNRNGLGFWKSSGWKARPDLILLQKET